MSYGSEILADSIANNAYYEHRAERALANGAWLTRDGREIPVSEMSNGHLVNSIKMMMRGGCGFFRGMESDALEMLANEAERRGLKVKVIAQ